MLKNLVSCTPPKEQVSELKDGNMPLKTHELTVDLERSANSLQPCDSFVELSCNTGNIDRMKRLIGSLHYEDTPALPAANRPIIRFMSALNVDYASMIG